MMTMMMMMMMMRSFLLVKLIKNLFLLLQFHLCSFWSELLIYFILFHQNLILFITYSSLFAKIIASNMLHVQFLIFSCIISLLNFRINPNHNIAIKLLLIIILFILLSIVIEMMMIMMIMIVILIIWLSSSSCFIIMQHCHLLGLVYKLVLKVRLKHVTSIIPFMQLRRRLRQGWLVSILILQRIVLIIPCVVVAWK